MVHIDQLGGADRSVYEAALGKSHERQVSIEIQKLSGEPQDRIQAAGFAGQIDVGRGGPEEVQRVLSFSAADRRQVFNFSAAAPGEGLFFDTQIEVTDARYIPALGFWVEATPFVGPIWSFRRQGEEISLVAHSKDRLAMGHLWRPINLRKGQWKISAQRELLEDAGEDRFDFPDPKSRGRIPERRGLNRYASPWAHAWRLAQSENDQLLYRGHRATIRKWPGSPAIRFRGGEGGLLLGDPAPEVERSLDGVANIIHVLGRKPKGNRKRPSAVARIKNPDHPLSPERLGRGGKPRFIVERIEDSGLRSDAECKRLADRLLADRIRGIVSAAFACAPVPHLDPGDIALLELEDDAVPIRLAEWTLPLLGGPMTVGQFKRSKIRKKKKHGGRG